MSDEEKEQIGFCKFCGQSRVVHTVSDDLNQLELDLLATDLCTCPDADKERRKKERKERIADFVDKHFKDEELRADIHDAIDKIWDPEHRRKHTLTSISLQPSEDMTIKIWKDADFNLRIKAKTVDNCELKV